MDLCQRVLFLSLLVALAALTGLVHCSPPDFFRTPCVSYKIHKTISILMIDPFIPMVESHVRCLSRYDASTPAKPRLLNQPFLTNHGTSHARRANVLRCGRSSTRSRPSTPRRADWPWYGSTTRRRRAPRPRLVPSMPLGKSCRC